MKWTRRELLKMGFGAFALQMAGFAPLRAALADKHIPLCLELYSIHDLFPKDPEKYLAAVKGMGYEGVEYAGFPIDVADLRKLQDKYGLICSGSHTGRGQIDNPDELAKTIEKHLVLGAKFIICPGMGNDGKQGWIDAAKKFSEAAAIARKSDLYVGYHAHQPDYKPAFDGESPWCVFGDNSSEDVVLQNDLGHCVNSGTDPYPLIARYPGRGKTIHLKESDQKIMGEGRVDWKRAFKVCETVGGVMHYVVEIERNFGTLEDAENTAKAYQKLHVNYLD